MGDIAYKVEVEKFVAVDSLFCKKRELCLIRTLESAFWKRLP